MAATARKDKLNGRKAFFPLESNPDVFTEVLHGLGVSKRLVFADVLSLDEPEILAMTPRPALALVLVFPTTPTYEAEKQDEEAKREAYNGKGEAEDVVWWKQTIYNACGLYGLLHAITNGPARQHIEKGSLMDGLLDAAIPLAPAERAKVLEGSPELERVHTAAALKGDTAPPEHADDDVLCHYVCFVQAQKSGHLYLLDGDRKGPVDLGVALQDGEDMLSAAALDAVRTFIRREQGANLNFNLLALVEAQD